MHLRVNDRVVVIEDMPDDDDGEEYVLLVDQVYTLVHRPGYQSTELWIDTNENGSDYGWLRLVRNGKTTITASYFKKLGPRNKPDLTSKADSC